jgi:hypothetical protein
VRNSIVNAGAQLQRVLLEDSVIGGGALVSGRFQRVNVGEDSEVRWE